VTRTITYREALTEALREELHRDPAVLVMGEDVGAFGGAFGVTDGLQATFGSVRVRDTPISENAIVGFGVGAAMNGLRPVVELMTVNFALLAFDQIVNHAAQARAMFGGQVRVPLVLRMPQGGGRRLGAVHSHTWEALFLHVPGLLVATPSMPADAKGLLKAAIRADDPVVFLEHEGLYGVRGPVADSAGRDDVVPFGRAIVRRRGTDVTIVGVSRMALVAWRAAEALARDHGIEAEVIDPRTLRPLDLDTIVDSVRRTGHCVVVEEGWPHGGVGATLATLVTEHAFDALGVPVRRVGGADAPMPYAASLERAAVPDEAAVVRAVRGTLAPR
jgi:pyruvate dehydrogenase E1 component beta subunit